jgi:uncharacterized membrane protein YbaN (DUF454 family)
LTTLPSNLASATDAPSGLASDRAPASSRSTRALLAGTGVCAVGLAGVGVVVPGMPTTVFLIVAAWCFARSSPGLTDRLIRTRFFLPFLQYIEPGARMPRRAKVAAVSIMWLAITLSCVLLASRGVTPVVLALIAGLGVLGTACIVRQGKSAAARECASGA